jgi:adenine-specific DNA-methyltransferase
MEVRHLAVSLFILDTVEIRDEMPKILEDYTKDELIEIIKGLKRRKKFGLVWEDKPEDVVRLCDTELPVLEEVAKRAIEKVKDAPTNLIIEGDNYHSLSVLNYTHTGKVDVIYIDPPYNTGGSGFRYDDKILDSTDQYRHSKWLSFMGKRLELAKSLLSRKGVIFISIDENEAARLKLLCDEVFGSENYVTTITVQVNKGGRDYLPIAVTHEYILCYSKSAEAVINELDKAAGSLKMSDDDGSYELRELRNRNPRFTRANRPNLYYPVYVNPNTANDKKECAVSLTKTSEYSVEALPKNSKGEDSCWRWGKPLFEKNITQDPNTSQVVARQKRDGGWNVYEKSRKSTSKAKSIWDESEVRTEQGTIDLRKLGMGGMFDHPKPVYLIKKCLKLATDKNSLVLDFMAGSGTTGQSLLELNEEDGGNRRFILCTNNENEIAEKVTYERVSRIVHGTDETEAIQANVRYFKTSLVSKQQTDDQTRIELVARSTDMICLREDTFEVVFESKLYKVFKNANNYSAIVFEPLAIQFLKETLDKLNDDMPAHIYVFSLSNDTYESDFADLERAHELRPIPESILEVYRRIHKVQKEELGL